VSVEATPQKSHMSHMPRGGATTVPDWLEIGLQLKLPGGVPDPAEFGTGATDYESLDGSDA